MAETYFLDDKQQNIEAVKYDKYVNKVFAKHKQKYGSDSAAKIRDNVTSIFKTCIHQVKNSCKNNNVLLVGKVQSGKTSNLEMFTAMAFDNGYNCVVIYGGYDNKLLDQTCKRFRKTFDIEEDTMDIDSPELLSTNDGKVVDALEDSLIENLILSGKPLIFVSMKRPRALERVNDIFSNSNLSNIKAFIIDDEGDQASLNTEFKKNRQSRTYEQIVKMKGNLSKPLYLSVTATPQANVLLGEYSDLRPDGLRLIVPGNGYTGAESFHLKEGSIYLIEDADIDLLSQSNIPLSLVNSITYFIIASAIMKKRGINKKGIYYSDMIIHTSRVNNDHKQLYNAVFSYIQQFKDAIKNSKEDWNVLLGIIKNIYSKTFFDEKIIKNYPFEDMITDIEDIVNNTHIILQDSKGKITQEHEKYKYHKIYIGGDLLQRGLTFEYLVATYFTRWPKNSGNMDTIIQRARWFGYRSDYLDLCKIFTTESIKMEYSALTESENDLWEQCGSIEKGELEISDIVIDADSTSLNPTRKNVANYTKIQFTRKWTNQKIGIADVNIVKKNNEEILTKFDGLDWIETNAGRNDSQPSAVYSYVTKEFLLDLINSTTGIFMTDPFKVKDIEYAIKDKKIIIEKLFDFKGADEYRTRTFNKNTMRISALQQGADTTVVERQKYKGDSHVIVDEDAVTIQVFRIRPIIDKNEVSDLEQYMFSIHIPEGKKGFVKV